MDTITATPHRKVYRLGLFVCAAVLFAFAFFAAGDQASAQFGLDTAVAQTPLKGTSTSLPVIIGRVISAALGLVGVVFLLLMLYGGFLWMTARGESEKVEKAKDTITRAIIGIIIIASAYALTSFVISRITGAGGAESGSTTSACEPPTTKSSLLGPCCSDGDCATTVMVCEGGLCKATEGAFCNFDDSQCASGLKCEGTICKS